MIKRNDYAIFILVEKYFVQYIHKKMLDTLKLVIKSFGRGHLPHVSAV